MISILENAGTYGDDKNPVIPLGECLLMTSYEQFDIVVEFLERKNFILKKNLKYIAHVFLAANVCHENIIPIKKYS